MSPIDAFVEQRTPPEFHGVVAALRDLMGESAPHAEERVGYGLPMWKGRGYLAWISPSKRGITFSFTYGASFVDPYAMLKGAGKHARHVRIKRLADLDRDALRYYIQQAVERDVSGLHGDAPARPDAA